ncbi:MAG: pyridoxamine 5'-phosphate oxidase [Pelagibacterales bacterium]|jgi:pyridoxamine 5'-phosphate oxidase|nr:pyridoxamine 5'-phosphate oxidase [Pelagibacterales bacterium]MAU28020.1 pyridoxamine 5'-phosphate oxidase [Pelagibacterales bacterium]OUV28220.1 MAG: pyridoxamine 5'-phosphate oxidase [Alphaproteobacteria bacterium TMED109]|tara:strand:+ start:2811 stop:3413 length:603 start_codon:yes stop_codon:yes gene_type:complete
MKSEEFKKFSDPMKLFSLWLDEAKNKEINDYNACCLATCDAAGIPSARMILLKKFDERGFVFFTNLQSRKAKEFERNVRVALCFHWKSLKKQIRIEGPLLELPKNEADTYFQSRARDSQIGAWASQQSSYLPKGYKSLEEKIEFYESKFKNQVVPRPSFWGGRIVVPERIEFWKDVKNRLHERMLFKADNENWLKEYLYP